MAEKAKTSKTTKTTKRSTKPAASAKKAVKSTKTVKSVKPVKVEAKAPARKSHKGVIIAIIFAILALAAAVGVAIYFWLSTSITYLVGNYTLTGMYSNGEDQSSSIKTLEDLGYHATMELKSDGTGAIHLFGKDSDLTFDKEKMMINDKEAPFTYEDGKITFSENNTSLTFTKDTE